MAEVAIADVHASTAPSRNFFVGIIDGTGPENLTAYGLEMAGGFCKQIETKNRLANRLYVPGPSLGGGRLDAAVNTIYGKAEEQHKLDNTRDIVLVGYSRGALGCILVAQKLKLRGIDVHSLILFDPVDRYTKTLAWPLIPNNVKASFRAYRKLNASVVLKYEGTIPTFVPDKDAGLLTRAGYAAANMLAPSNPFRPSFSSTGLGVEHGGYYDAAHSEQHYVNHYACSHGAMGGVGYTWIAEDHHEPWRMIADLRRWLSKRLEWNLQLKAAFDPDPAFAAPQVGVAMQAVIARQWALFDKGLITLERLDFLISKLSELRSAL